MTEATVSPISQTSKEALFHVSIKERVRLTHPSSSKETYHIVLDLSGTSLHYEVGDCVGIHPTNEPAVVEKILHLLDASGNEIVYDRHQHPLSFADFLSKKANISRVSKELYRLITGHEPAQSLATLELQDLLEEFPRSIAPLQLSQHLPPLLPRLYSIASSQAVVGDEIHLTVALSIYEKNGQRRFGVCSSFLCHRTPLNESQMHIYLHKAKDFGLAPGTHEKPLIMIGPGTGVAPFRGFMQERLHSKVPAKHWLFFGERNQDTDFYYQDFWRELEGKGHLHLDLAFSRDQTHKIYVQHKMLEKSSLLWRWIQEGAILYVCGDAARMAKDVDTTLHNIAMQEGNLDKEAARAFFKQLRKDKRYLRDVY